MNSSKRGAAFSIEEDILLVMAYLDVSQNPIIGINQSRDRLWSLVAATYNEQLAGNSTEPRTTKALQCRWFNINKIVQNFSSCVSQVELSRPSGASEKVILDQAKALFKQSAGSTWRLDHSYYSPNTESPTPDSPGLSGFAINLDEDNPSGGSYQRPIGIKKAKAKRKATEEHLKDISTMAKCTEKMVAVMENAEVHRQQLIDIEKQRNAIMAFKEENKILRMNPMCVDESVRAYLIKEQQKIWQKRMETGDGSDGTSTPFGEFL
ncbi:uncharacterized protein [Primulina huaijiensis]|uniref:uncharacterized protein n=1 Tax=Primulina huaijiensis TaxID=1492673 RepID=UPI003CC75571